MSAWIEILFSRFKKYGSIVALYMSAWIEMYEIEENYDKMSSHST